MLGNYSLMMFVIVCPAVFLAGFVDAIAGGGGMISLPAYMMKIGAHNAVATNKMSSAIGTAVSTYRYCKNGYIDWMLAIPTVILSFIGSVIGANLVLMTGDMAIKIVLLCTLPIITFLVFKNKDLKPINKFNLTRKGVLIWGSVLSFIVGIYDGFYGPGTGTFLLLGFTLILGLDVKTASGNVKLCNLTSNVAALMTFLIHGQVLILLGATAAVFSIAGHYTGSSLVMKNGIKIVRPIMLVVISILYIKICYEAFF